MSKKSAAIFISSLMVFVGLYYLLQFTSDPVVTQIGDYKILKSDVELRNQLNKLYYPESKNDYGLEQLTKAFTAAMILKNNGNLITGEMIKGEEQRIDQRTKSPEMLNKIKAIFKGDKSAYRRVFILPNLVNNRIKTFYSNNDILHTDSKKEAEKILQSIKQSKVSVESAAKDRKLQFAKMKVSRWGGIEWVKSQQTEEEKADSELQNNVNIPKNIQPDLNKRPRRERALAPLWLSEIEGLNVDNPLPNVLSYQSYWLVGKIADIKMGEENNKQIFIDIMFFPKHNFNQWLENEKKKFTK